MCEEQVNQHDTLIGDGASRKPNPYKLIWYDSSMTEKQIAINNAKFWEWEGYIISTNRNLS